MSHNLSNTLLQHLMIVLNWDLTVLTYIWVFSNFWWTRKCYLKESWIISVKIITLICRNSRSFEKGMVRREFRRWNFLSNGYKKRCKIFKIKLKEILIFSKFLLKRKPNPYRLLVNILAIWDCSFVRLKYNDYLKRIWFRSNLVFLLRFRLFSVLVWLSTNMRFLKNNKMLVIIDLIGIENLCLKKSHDCTHLHCILSSVWNFDKSSILTVG